MTRILLSSKIHRARVTDANLEYEGSITIDQELLDQAGMVEYEQVLVVNLSTGARFETYIIAGEPGSGAIEINGAAARLVSIGDQVIIMAFEMVDEESLADWRPTRVLVDEMNKVKEILC